MPFFRPVKSKKRSKRYGKVSHKVKIQLLKSVLCDKREIKETADDLEVNYSTAKTLMRKYHRFGNQLDFQVLDGICRWYEEYEKSDKPRCGYRDLEAQVQKVKVEQSSGEAKVQPSCDETIYKAVIPAHSHQIELFQQVLFKH